MVQRTGIFSAASDTSGDGNAPAPDFPSLSFPSLEFPTLDDSAATEWHWPRPPFDWDHVAGPGLDAAQPCRLTLPSGSALDGVLLGFDAVGRSALFRMKGGSQPTSVSFGRFTQLDLLTPLQAATPFGGGVAARLPLASQARSYQFESIEGGAIGWRIDSIGHVDRDEGVYLFVPIEEDRALQRVFVPRSAFASYKPGLSAEDAAAERWVSRPAELLEAIERQKRMPVLPIGQSLLELGLVTQAQLDRALAEPPGAKPLGETLVDQGIINHADLQTALAHKMGYPLVDLTRFPVDRGAARKLTLRMATALRAVPLMLDGPRLIVAVDRLSRVPRLSELQTMSGVNVVPVLASKSQIKVALAGLSQLDVWAHNVPGQGSFFPTTT